MEIKKNTAVLTMDSKRERLVSIGCKDFLSFGEQLDARMHSIKLGKVLSGDDTYLGYMQPVRNNYSKSNAGKISKRAGLFKREEKSPCDMI